MALIIADPIAVTHPDECVWYHTFDFPDGSLVRGRWDYRANVDDYLGRLDYRNTRVLELGPASGFLTRALEQRGADVLCLDTGPDHVWDIAPRHDRDTAAYDVERQSVIGLLWKSWWLSRNVFNGTAKISYSGAASLANLIEPNQFDIGLVGSILQHFDNPYVILSHVARLCSTIVVTEQYLPRLDLPGRAIAEFVPRPDNNDLGSWWLLSPALVEQMLATLNFKKEQQYFSTFRRWDLKYADIAADTYRDAKFYTQIYRKTPGNPAKFNQLQEA